MILNVKTNGDFYTNCGNSAKGSEKSFIGQYATIYALEWTPHFDT